MKTLSRLALVSSFYFRLSSIMIRSVLLALALVICMLSNAEGGIEAVSGNVEEISAPASVVLGALEDDTVVRLFAERTAFLLPQDMTVDVSQPGTVDEASDLTPAQILAGTLVDSYLLHADPVGPGQPIRQYEGSVTFNVPILGALVTHTGLGATDSIVGSPTTIYAPADIDRGFEGPGFRTITEAVRDLLTLSTDFRTVSFHLRSESRLDQVRIITVAVPEPSSLAIVSLAFLLLGRRRIFKSRFTTHCGVMPPLPRR